MASSFNTAGNVSTSVGSPSTQVITATTTANDILIVTCRANSGTNPPVSATYGGVAGTILSSDNNATIQAALILFLAPPTGVQTLSISGGTTEQYVGSYAFYSGEAQSGQPSTTNYLTNNTTQPNSRTITASPAGMVITATASADGATLNSGATQRNNFDGSIIADSNGDAGSLQTVSVSVGTRAHSVWQIALTPQGAVVKNNFFLMT